ncbi:MAG: hypothetical protein JSW47_00320 [Phycisphaerales bacterium]|nr:MAG: hypothetical protein JSW47_00320 [Phycisphaerales bacterium]
MHNDHGIFERGAAQCRKIRLTFFAGEPRRELISQCGPLYFSSGRADMNEPDCYYFWDFEAKVGRNFIALVPSDIVAMELTENSFSLEEIHGSRRRTEHSRSGNGPAGI